ncbi:MAG: alpha/beta hydrolase [Proteobacteria bacterium]|nr:alpha/beta hydrolase [Pseudomonadota bacterium]NOG61066.1 alpha/beta hydrolase [Pseudomonadota bacterium]
MSKSNVKRLNVQYISLLLLLLFISSLSLPVDVQANETPYPGQLINIGSHRLHIHCVGEGTPSVIIDSGIGGFSLEWSKIQDSLSTNARICSYDRAGYGWSDPGPRPRTTARISRELKTLLKEAKIPGPYVLVGHSFGGYNIRYFASESPELVAGLVFIDSSHPEQFNTEEFKRVARTENKETKYKKSYRVRLIRPIIAENYPQNNKRLAFRLMSSYKSKSTLINESDFMKISAKQVALRSNEQPYTFPVVIITRGKRVWPHNELGDRREQQWSNLQNDLENLAIKPYHFKAYSSGHVVHLDQPELVSENILLTVEKARRQIFEEELIKKFDIRQANHVVFPEPIANETTYELNTINFEKYSFFDAPIHQTKFDPELLYLRNRKSFP